MVVPESWKKKTVTLASILGGKFAFFKPCQETVKLHVFASRRLRVPRFQHIVCVPCPTFLLISKHC